MVRVWQDSCYYSGRNAAEIKKGEATVTIEKKSLISNLKAAKKAIVASKPTVEAETSEVRANTRRSNTRLSLRRSSTRMSTRRSSTRMSTRRSNTRAKS
jgi:hypothetical protein